MKKAQNKQLQSKTAPVAPPPIWGRLPVHARKAAHRGGIRSSDAVVKGLCVECKKEMWTPDPKRFNVCELCDRLLSDQIRDMQAMRRDKAQGKLVVPSDGGDRFINPLGRSGGLF